MVEETPAEVVARDPGPALLAAREATGFRVGRVGCQVKAHHVELNSGSGLAVLSAARRPAFSGKLTQCCQDLSLAPGLAREDRRGRREANCCDFMGDAASTGPWGGERV